MKTRTAFGQKTLSGRYFTSSDIYAAEWEQIFNQHWLCVGRESQIDQPGAYFLLQIGPESVIMLKDQAGQVRAFYNVCRHRGTRLCQDGGQFSHSLQCPYHAWTYGLDGRLLGAPTMQEVGEFDKADYGLHAVATAVWEGFIFVNLSPNPEPFETAFAPLLHKLLAWEMGQLKVGRQIIYEVAANWKIIFHNYSECYHCPAIHPQLNELTPYRNSSNDLEEGFILGGPMKMSRPEGSMTMNGRVCAPILNQTRGRVYYYTIFPTMFLSLFPDYVMTHRLEPQSPGRTRVICDWLFAPEAAGSSHFQPEEAIKFWDMTNQQDWEVCQLTQLGVASKAFTPGPYSDLESMLAAFDRAYLQALGHH